MPSGDVVDAEPLSFHLYRNPFQERGWCLVYVRKLQSGMQVSTEVVVDLLPCQSFWFGDGVMQSRFGQWRKGDLDGFFGLFIDNLIQLILIVLLCRVLLQMPDAMVFGRILPGVAVSLLVGNLFYAWQAAALARSGEQAQVTALPYGVNTVSLFAFVLFVMKPVLEQTQDVELAWRVGLAACFGSGLIEFAGAFVASWIKRITPRAALLSTLAGIAITFISMDYCFRIFADPLVGFLPLALILAQYIGGIKLPGAIPAGLIAVMSGVALAWGLGRIDSQALAQAMHWQFEPHLWQHLFSSCLKLPTY